MADAGKNVQLGPGDRARQVGGVLRGDELVVLAEDGPDGNADAGEVGGGVVGLAALQFADGLEGRVEGIGSGREGSVVLLVAAEAAADGFGVDEGFCARRIHIAGEEEDAGGAFGAVVGEDE